MQISHLNYHVRLLSFNLSWDVTTKKKDGDKMQNRYNIGTIVTQKSPKLLTKSLCRINYKKIKKNHYVEFVQVVAISCEEKHKYLIMFI